MHTQTHIPPSISFYTVREPGSLAVENCPSMIWDVIFIEYKNKIIFPIARGTALFELYREPLFVGVRQKELELELLMKSSKNDFC